MLFTAITIGRNVGSEPMSDYAWKAFRARAGNVLVRHLPTAHVEPAKVGPGGWEDEPEDAAVVFALGGSMDAGTVTAIRNDLAALADAFGQAAIGLAVGGSVLTWAAGWEGERYGEASNVLIKVTG